MLTIFCLTGFYPNISKAFVIPDFVSPRHLSDFLDLDTHNRQIRYQMESDYWTNADQERMLQGLRKVINTSLEQSFIDLNKNPEQNNLVEVVKGHIVKSVLKQFLFNHSFFNFLKYDFQFNLKLVPYLDNVNQFDNELSSNQLIDTTLEEMSLYDFVTGPNEGLPQKTLKIIPLITKQDKWGFLSGQIMLEFQTIKGLSPGSTDLTYRKYFYHPRTKIQFLTIDTIYNFALAGKDPTLKKVVIYPGQMKGSSRPTEIDHFSESKEGLEFKGTRISSIVLTPDSSGDQGLYRQIQPVNDFISPSSNRLTSKKSDVMEALTQLGIKDLVTSIIEGGQK